MTAVVLSILSAIWFQPAEWSTNPPLVQATVAALLSGVALLIALFLTTHKVQAAPLTEQRISPARINWLLIVPGIVLMAFGTEVSADFLTNGALVDISPHIQFVSLAGGLILFTMGMIGVRRLHVPRLNVSRSEILIFIAVGVFALIVRAYAIDSQHISVDEGHYMYGAAAFLSPGYTPHLLTTIDGNLPATMIYSYWSYIAILVFGRNLVGLRMATAIMGALNVLAIYGAARALFNRRIAIIAALILATFPLHLFYSRISTGNLGDALFSTLAILFAARAFRDNRHSDWVLLGVNLGLSQYFFEGGRLLFPPVFICWFILLALVLGGRFKLLRRGIFLAIIVSLVVVLPMYFTMWATQAPFNARLTSDGFDLNQFIRALSGVMTPDQMSGFVQHVTAPFLVYTFYYHHSMLEMYGGFEPVVLRVFVPLFLLGVFHVLGRLRSASTLVLIALLGTSVGGILVADPLIFARYSIITPVVALLMAFGLGCTLPMLNPLIELKTATQRRWSAIGARLAVGLAVIIAAVQLDYFYDHLIPEFTYTYHADGSVATDAMDDALRFASRPNSANEQLVIFDTYVLAPNLIDEYLDMSFGPHSYTTWVLNSSDVTLSSLDALPRDRTYVFYVASNRPDIMHLLGESFVLSPPSYSPWSNPVPIKLYLEFVALQNENPPRPATPTWIP
ncbi:MAG TPA: glycosyltransferase family 39 protein [Phototrophicaceae bacterium]|nr:glycosyltransferase family 39 protein [Phototrophicaceae bacterium]